MAKNIKEKEDNECLPEDEENRLPDGYQPMGYQPTRGYQPNSGLDREDPPGKPKKIPKGSRKSGKNGDIEK